MASGYQLTGGGGGGGGGVTDHGALTGLLDNDHPQYFLVTGGTISGSIIVTNTTSLNGAVTLGNNITWFHAAKVLSAFNSVAGDTDGARSSLWRWGGYKTSASGANAGYHAAIDGVHDGTGADWKGRIEAFVNAGAEGPISTPTNKVWTLDSDGDSAFTGECTSLLDHRCFATNDGNQTIADTDGDTVLELDRTQWEDGASFTHDTSNHEIDCDFDGAVEVSLSVQPTFSSSTGSRMTTRFWIEWWDDSASSWIELEETSCRAYTYSQSGTLHATVATCTPFPIEVADGDKFRVVADVEIVSSAIVINEDQARLRVKRIRTET